MPMRAGIASTDITPPLGLDVAGYLWTGPTKGTADPLSARAVVLDDGSAKIALVALDLLGIERPDSLVTTRLIEDRIGIPQENIMISCSHTHFGPATYRRSSVCRWPAAYMEALPYRIADVVMRAADGLRPMEWGYESGQDDRSGFYRRLRWSDGKVRMPWPALRPSALESDPAIVGPTGAIDPTVDVLGIRRPESGEPLAVLVSYSAHATCGPQQHWSASYPGRLAAHLGEELGLGPDRVLFMPGASGNIEPASDNPDEIGRSLATEALSAFQRISWTSDGGLRAEVHPISLPSRELSGFPIEMVADVHEPIRGSDPKSFAKIARYYANEYLRLLERGDDPHETILQVVAIGDVAFVAIPGEPFIELATEIKQRSPFGHTIVVSLANDTVGYIPDAASFPDGGYELIPAWQSRLAPEAGNIIVDAAANSMGRLFNR